MDTKICGKCKQEKQLSEYGNNVTKKDKLQSNCKICARLITREYYKNNKEHHLKVIMKARKIRLISMQTFIFNYLKSHPCVDCVEKDPIVLEFDHVKDIKTHSISYLTQSSRCSISVLEKEIEKCEVRCANCHRRKTAKQFSYFRYEFSNKIIE